MDVRCEKCQTEYELDEARLKPGGVTVKCTNCGHMFKIRKRSNTNVGAAPQAQADAPRAKPPSKPAATHSAQPQQTAAGPGYMRADSMLDDAPTKLNDGEGPTTERQWLIRLENGEQKSTRELGTLQQWIIAGQVTRESLISRSGKTWKRLGDIPELKQYFEIADEARTTARTKPAPSKPPVSTTLGVGNAPTAAGGTILPDDEPHTTPRRVAMSTPPPVPRKTPPHGAPATASPTNPPPARRPITTPPPPPPKKEQSAPAQMPQPSAIPAPTGNRATAAWASESIKADPRTSAPFGGKISAIPDEPAFAGRVRGAPSSEESFDTARVKLQAPDDDVLPRRKGSSAGLWILLVVLLLGAGTTAALYFFVFKKDEPVAKAPADAAPVAQIDAAPVVTPVIDAPPAPPANPLEAAHHELWGANEARMQTAYDGLAGKEEPDAQALRSLLGTELAQALLDRAGLVGDKSEAEKLRKQSKTIVLEAATLAQKSHKATPDEPSANVAYAAVLRLQGKPAKDVRRFLEVAKVKAGDWSRDVALGEALLLAREGKLEDAKTAFAAIDTGDGKLETSNDVRARFHVALLDLAQGKPADAKPLVDQVLAAQPDHAAAKALAAKLDTLVAKTDPLPPEDPGKGSGSGSAVTVGPGSGSGSGSATKPPDGGNTGGGKDDYDGYVKKADAVADSNCTKANELYAKALELKPNGVEALTGQGYCALEAKNFSTAHRKFSTALATSARYEPALAGIAETYTLQGRKDDAIAAWRRYLEAYPGSAKGTKALDRLGAGAGTPTPPTGSGTTPGSDAPPPTPTPTPTPPPAGSGSG